MKVGVILLTSFIFKTRKHVKMDNEMVSLGDTAISLHILQPPPGGAKVGIELREENWSLEISGGCSAKGQIWTWGRKLEFGNFGEGVFCQRSDSDSGRKLEFGNLGGGGVLPKVRFGIGEDFASQIVSHILRLWRLIRKVNGCWMGDKCFWSVCSSNQIANCCSLCRLYVVYFSVSLMLNAGYLNALIRNIGYG